jgi:AcrR family transcriptional regulator
MEIAFDTYCTYGLGNVGIKGIAQACGLATPALYAYFEGVDDMILQSVEHCLSKIEREFAEYAIRFPESLDRFLDEAPLWSREQHGKAYRFLQQIYTHPKYYDHCQKIIKRQEEEYDSFASKLAPKMGITKDDALTLVFLLARLLVHYALYGSAEYLRTQKQAMRRLVKVMKADAAPAAE